MRIPRLLDDEGFEPSQLLDLLERSSTGVFFWDARNDAVEWSPGIFKALGYDTPKEATYGDIEALVHPDDRAPMNEAVKRTRATIGEYQIELRLRDFQEGFRHFRVFGKWYRSGDEEFLIGFLDDVTELAEARVEADRSMEMLKAFFDNAPAAVFIKNKDQRHIYGNRFAARLAGCSLGEFLAKSTPELFGPKTAEELWRADQAVIEKGELVTRTGEVNTRSGERFIVFDTKFPLSDPKTGETLVGGFGIDVTAQHRMEQALAESRKLEALGQLVTGIAHDFNNSLSIMQGSLDLIALAESREELEQYRNDLQGGIERGMRLTRELLSYGRKALLEHQVLNLNTVLEAMGLLLRRALPENIEIETALGEALWNSIVDRSQFENAVLNLALNAKDAMPDGGKLTIETDNVDISEDYVSVKQESISPGRYVMVAVTDTGSGMSADVLRQAIDPFFTTKAPNAGTGMGLASVDGLVRQLGGATQIYSEPGIGTTVKLYFPVSENAANKEEDSQPRQLVGGSERILVVEDEDSVRRLVSRQLSKLGYDVVEAADGSEALSIFTGDSAFDLLITDVVMPGKMQGPVLAKEIRAKDPTLPIIFISGYPLHAARNGGFLGDHDTVLMKPVEIEKLASAVRAGIDRAG